MVNAPLAEVFQVLFSLLGSVFSLGELFDVQREIKNNWKYGTPDETYTYASLAVRTILTLVFIAQMVFLVTGIWVIGWRQRHPLMLPLAPAFARSYSIIIVTFLLALVSLLFRLYRHRLIDMGLRIASKALSNRESIIKATSVELKQQNQAIQSSVDQANEKLDDISIKNEKVAQTLAATKVIIKEVQ